MRRNTLLFKIGREENTITFSQTRFSSILLILIVVGFLIASIITREFSWILSIGIIVTLDLLLEWVIIIFLKKDATSDGNQVSEFGSIWNGSKKYKIIPAVSQNSNRNLV